MVLEESAMLYMVCYDIGDDGRRREIQKVLEGYGSRVQYSVFDCEMSDLQYRRLREEILCRLNEAEDSVRFYPLCSACSRKIDAAGTGCMDEDDGFFMV